MSVRVTAGSNYLLLQSDATVLTEEEAKNCITTLKSRPERLPAIIFDLSQVGEISENAFRTLSLVLSIVSQRSAQLAVITSGKITELIAAQSLDRFFPCYPTLNDALLHLNGEETRRKTEEFLNATMDAVTFTLQTTVNVKVSAGETFSRTNATREALEALEIGAVVGLISIPFTGSLIIGFRKDTYLKIMSRLFSQEFLEITPDIQDGAAEILNIVLGHVKTTLNEKGYGLKQAIPSVVQGQKMQIVPAANHSSYIVPYTSEFGQFYLELTTSTRSELKL